MVICIPVKGQRVYVHHLGDRLPNMEVPTLTVSLPIPIAISKSEDIPMLSSKWLLLPQAPSSELSWRSNTSKASRVSFNLSKSGLPSLEVTEFSKDPIVIRPNNRSWGHSWIMNLARSTKGPSVGDVPLIIGGTPDFWPSSEVFTWRYIFKGSDLVEGKERFKAIACLELSTVWTAYKFGMALRNRSE